MGTCQKWIELGNGSNTVNEMIKLQNLLNGENYMEYVDFMKIILDITFLAKKWKYNKTHFIS